MSTKELVVELRIPLPTDLFEQADALSKAKYCMDAIKTALPDDMAHTVTSEIVTRRATATPATVNGTNGAAAPRRSKAAEPAPQPAAA